MSINSANQMRGKLLNWALVTTFRLIIYILQWHSRTGFLQQACLSVLTLRHDAYPQQYDGARSRGNHEQRQIMQLTSNLLGKPANNLTNSRRCKDTCSGRGDALRKSDICVADSRGLRRIPVRAPGGCATPHMSSASKLLGNALSASRPRVYKGSPRRHLTLGTEFFSTTSP